jgi:hypothetical protein
MRVVRSKLEPRSLPAFFPLLNDRSEEIASTCESMMIEVLERHGSRVSLRFLVRHLRGSILNDYGKARLARIVQRCEGTEAREIVIGLLGSNDRLDRALLQNIVGFDQGMDPMSLDELVEYLDRGLLSEDAAIRRECARLSGVVREHSLAFLLVELLSDADPGVKGNAYWALRELSGLSIKPDPRRWQSWLREEESWWQARNRRLLTTLESGSSTELMEALAALGRHPLFLNAVRESVETLLLHDSPEVRLRACTLLSSFRSRVSIPLMIGCLHDSSEDVVRAAHAGLVALTGRSLPANAEEWTEWHQRGSARDQVPMRGREAALPPPR